MMSVKVIVSVCLLCFLFASFYWLHRLRVLQQGLLPLSLLHQLHTTVGHQQDREGGQRETWRRNTKKERERQSEGETIRKGRSGSSVTVNKIPLFCEK